MSDTPKIYSCRLRAMPYPPDAVYVGRYTPNRDDCPPNPWANPFHMSERGGLTRDEACDKYEEYAVKRLAREPDWLAPLRGKPLLCWCKPHPTSSIRCHAETLVRLANPELFTAEQETL